MRKSRNTQTLKNRLTSARKAKIARIQRASARVWQRMESGHFRSTKQAGQGSKKTCEQAGAINHKMVGLDPPSHPTGSGNKRLKTMRLFVVFRSLLATFL